MTDIEIDLPLPVSVNMIWGRGRRGAVYRRPEYVRWQKQADALMYADSSWRSKKIAGRYTATLILNEGMMRPNQDADNLMKVPLDYARRLDLVADDSITYCRRCLIMLGDDSNAPTGARLILRSID